MNVKVWWKIWGRIRVSRLQARENKCFLGEFLSTWRWRSLRGFQLHVQHLHCWRTSSKCSVEAEECHSGKLKSWRAVRNTESQVTGFPVSLLFTLIFQNSAQPQFTRTRKYCTKLLQKHGVSQCIKHRRLNIKLFWCWVWTLRCVVSSLTRDKQNLPDASETWQKLRGETSSSSDSSDDLKVFTNGHSDPLTVWIHSAAGYKIKKLCQTTVSASELWSVYIWIQSLW